MSRAEEPRVSIVIPTFNRSALVSKAVDSALQQTFPDFEIVVIDDGSTDDTADTLRRYLGRIRYFYQDNRGASAAQNQGIALARAPWISVLASDDLWLPTKLETQFRALGELGDEFGACFTDCVYMGNPAMTASAFEQARLECLAEFGPLDHPLKYVLAKHPALYVQSMLVSRSALERAGRFDERLVIGEDTDLLFRLSFHTRFCVVRAPLVRIDRRPSRQHGLSDLFHRSDDAIFDCIERRYRKWLALPELTDRRIRGDIHDALRGLYYRWAIARLSGFRLAAAFTTIRQIRRTGHSFPTIGVALVLRVARRLLSTLRSWLRPRR